MAIKYFNVLELRPNPSLGTWTTSVASNIPQLAKVAADETPVLTFTIPRTLLGSGWGNPRVQSVSCQYAVATAALDAAPTVTFNKLTMADDTRVVSRAAAADTTTITGTNTVGTATGTYAVKGSFDALQTLEDNENLTAEFAFDCAATTVLTIRGLLIEVA